MIDSAALDTRAVHAAREDLAALGVHVPPIHLSSTYPVPDVETGGAAYEHLATGGTLEPGQTPVYQRLWNPTVTRFESAPATWKVRRRPWRSPRVWRLLVPAVGAVMG